MTDTTDDGEQSYRSLLFDPQLVLIVTASSVGIFGMQAVSPALPNIASALSVSEARIGLVVSAYFFPTMLMVPFAGAFADIVGRRRPLIAGLVLLGLGGVGIAFVDSFHALLAFRVIQGFGLAGIGPIAVTIIGDLYSGAQGSTAQGFRLSGHGIVQIVIPLVAGFLASIRWNYAFFLFAVAIPLAVLVAIFLPETGSSTRSTTVLRDEIRTYITTIRTKTTDSNLGVLLVGGFLVNFLRSAIMVFGPLLAVQSLGASAFIAGALLSLRGGVRVVTSPLSGVLVDRLSRKLAFVIVVCVVGISGVIFARSENVVVLAVAFAVYSVGEAFFLPIVSDIVTVMATDDSRGGFVGLLTESRLFGSVVGPVFFGALLSIIGFSGMFVISAALMFAYALAAQLLLDAAVVNRE
jgi:MFS family permease